VRTLAALVWKDLVIEARTRELLTSMSLVAFLALVILSLALGTNTRLAAAGLPAALWVTVAFAATLGLARAQALEQEGEALQGLLLTPVSRAVLYFGKCLANLVLVLALVAIAVVAAAVLLTGEGALRSGWLWLPLALGAVGFTAAGTLLGAMAASTRLRELLLPILLLPTALPVIMLSLAGLDAVLGGAPLSQVLRSLKLLAAVDIIWLMLGAWLYPYAVEE
jgi:heme exporter protein B